MTGEVRMSWSYKFPNKCGFSPNYPECKPIVAEAEKAKKETPKQQLEKKNEFIQQWAVAFSMSPERRINLFLNVKKGQRVETATPSVG